MDHSPSFVHWSKHFFFFLNLLTLKQKHMAEMGTDLVVVLVVLTLSRLLLQCAWHWCLYFLPKALAFSAIQFDSSNYVFFFPFLQIMVGLSSHTTFRLYLLLGFHWDLLTVVRIVKIKHYMYGSKIFTIPTSKWKLFTYVLKITRWDLNPLQ